MSKYIAGTAVMMAGLALTGCALESPFGDGGEGILSISTEMNGDVKKNTRAIESDEMAQLREKCVVFIENSRGVMRKYKGVDNIPQSIRLGAGNYVCNAWSGDSVSASFSEKFYRGQAKFDIADGRNTDLLVKCNIANVVVSVDPKATEIGLNNLTITVSSTKGELVFDQSNIATAKGYFMTPSLEVANKDAEAYARNTTLTIKVSGEAEDGSAFNKSFELKDVQRAHEYAISLTKNPGQITQGGALIQLVVKDIPLIEDTIDVFSAPNVRGIGYDIDEPVDEIESKDMKVAIRAYFGLNSARMVMGSSFQNTGLEGSLDLLDADTQSALAARGISIDRPAKSKDAETGVDVEVLYVTVGASYISTLPKRDDLFDITFDAMDDKGQSTKKSVSFYNTLTGKPTTDPATPDASALNNLLNFGVSSAYVTAFLNDDTAADYGIEYREAGASAWIKVSAKSSTGAPRKTPAKAKVQSYGVALTGLKAGTTYEYRAYADEVSSKDVLTFTTESVFVLPNASFEEWSSYTAKTMLGTKNIVLPWSVGDKEASFWGSGNEGAATANMTLTDKSTDMVHSGTYSVRLASKKAMGMLAAGNIFTGTYIRTDGTNGVLSFGRPFNCSHPSKVRVWANYRPGTVDVVKETSLEMKTGDIDQGTVYVALATEPIEIRTDPKNRKLLDPNQEEIVGYGQVTWNKAFGADGQLELVEIPITYNDRAQKTKPTYLILVGSASKFGDYYTGSSTSVMYLDDFELIYE